MLLRFHGADRTVTGSCHFVEANSRRLLLDFGLFQGQRAESQVANSTLPSFLAEPASRPHAVLLSHGHLDHCGRLPLLVRNGFRGPIYCTAATADVARVVLLDAAHIQQEDAQYLSKRSPHAHRVEPLFTEGDVRAVIALFKPVQLGKAVELGQGVSATFFDAGHILGSAYIAVTAREGEAVRSLLFTADVGRYNTPIIRDPHDLGEAMGVLGLKQFDAVITESTYGTVRHAPMEQVGPQLLGILQGALQKKGRVIIPSFAVGRTQTMLWYIQRFIQAGKLPEIPVFVDSPMGAEISRITAAHADAFDEETRAAVCDDEKCDLFGYSKVTFTVSSEESRRINNLSEPCVIIASSPTCEFGRVLHHLKRSIENPADTVVFVGFTPPNTLGRRLQSGKPGTQVRILDRYYRLACQVQTLHGLSAHADGDELLRFLKPTLSPRTTAFVVHGEEDRTDGFAARLTSAGVSAAFAPAQSSTAAIGAAPASVLAGSGGGAPETDE